MMLDYNLYDFRGGGGRGVGLTLWTVPYAQFGTLSRVHYPLPAARVLASRATGGFQLNSPHRYFHVVYKAQSGALSFH
jgi:hypothetical protein